MSLHWTRKLPACDRIVALFYFIFWKNKTTTIVADELLQRQWALVLTGVSDLARPAENLSATQNIALTATGAIWTRWCLIIKPKNYMLVAASSLFSTIPASRKEKK